MERYDECEIILVENFEVFGFALDVVREEIKYLNEQGVKIVSVAEGELTPDNVPELYRKQFKIIVCNGKNRLFSKRTQKYYRQHLTKNVEKSILIV